MRHLVGFARPAVGSPGQAADSLEEIDIRAVAAELMATVPLDWPWQLSAETLAQLAPPWRAFRLGAAAMVISDDRASAIGVRALTSMGRQHSAELALLRAVVGRYSGTEWRVSAVWPEESGAVFQDAGFVRGPLTQWQMERTI